MVTGWPVAGVGSYDDTVRIWDVADLAPAARPIAGGDDAVAAYVARQAATVGRRAVQRGGAALGAAPGGG